MRLTPAGLPGADGYGPGEVALLRFGTASVVLALYALFTRMRLPDRRDLGRIAIAGLTGITIYHLALNFGEMTVQAGAASLLIAAGPVFTALMSTAFLGERLTFLGWLGIAVAFVGVALISLSQGGGLAFDPGALLILLAAVSTSVFFIVSKKPLAHYSALEFTSYSIWAGTIPLLYWAPGLIEQIPDRSPLGDDRHHLPGHLPGRHRLRALELRAGPDAGIDPLVVPLPRPGAGYGDSVGLARRAPDAAHRRGRSHRDRGRGRGADQGPGSPSRHGRR